MLLPRISQSTISGDLFLIPPAWQDQIVAQFENLNTSSMLEGVSDAEVVPLSRYSALLRLLECTSSQSSTSTKISEILLRRLKLALTSPGLYSSVQAQFITTHGFKAYLRLSKSGTTDMELRTLLRAAMSKFARSATFLECVLEYEQRMHQDEQTEKQQAIDGSVFVFLTDNLSSCSAELRTVTLQLMQRLNTSKDAEPLIATMLQIEETPVTITGVRAFGMHIRTLTLAYAHVEAGSWLARAVPFFLFGTLTIKLSPVWDDASEAMKQVSRTEDGAEAIRQLAFDWLNIPSPKWSGPEAPPRWNALTPFDCTRLIKLNKSAAGLLGVFGTPNATMIRDFGASQKQSSWYAHNARSQAIRVLGSVPDLAEKRSKHLVPVFLGWAETAEEAVDVSVGDGAQDILKNDAEPEQRKPSSDPMTAWSLPDRKGLLGVFGKFLNPRALYQSEKVFAVLLELLKNGDADMQKLVLKALFTWKQEGVRPYQERLESLLEDNKFKNEITLLLQSDVEGIRPEHRNDLMPILLRLLFGRSISKKGAKNVATGNRLTIIRNLTIEDMGAFLDIAIGRLKDVRVVDLSSASHKKLFDQPIISVRNQYGFLNMISSLVTELGKNTSLYIDQLLNSVMYCIIYAYKHTNVDDSEPVAAASVDNPVELLKSVRTMGLKCLNLLFQQASSLDWSSYRPSIMREVVAPRIDKLPIETAQSVSGLLQLFSTWSRFGNMVSFFAKNGNMSSIMPKIIDCLAVESAKDDVKIFVLGIIRQLVKVADDPMTDAQVATITKSELLETNSSVILAYITSILRTPSLGISLLEAAIDAVVDLAPMLEHSDQTVAVLDIATFLLRQPPRRVSPKVKGRILLIVEKFVALFADVPASPAKDKIAAPLYDTLSSLFSYFKDRENREALARIFRVLAETLPDLEEVATAVTDLNSYSKRRMDEPDYDRRLVIFTSVCKERAVPINRRLWQPLLHNFLFFIKTDEEFDVLSSNSADGLCRFIRDAAACEDATERMMFDGDLEKTILPALYAGAKEES